MDFEYQIDVVKPHPEIHVSPLMGDILGLQTTMIDFTYNPRTHSTAECEIEIRTTEFDSQPTRIRIVGNAAPTTGVPRATGLDYASYGNGSNFKPGPLNVIHEEDQASNLIRDPQPKTLLQVRARSRGANRSIRMNKGGNVHRSAHVGVNANQNNNS